LSTSGRKPDPDQLEMRTTWVLRLQPDGHQ
jgi:hypothetical protein